MTTTRLIKAIKLNPFKSYCYSDHPFDIQLAPNPHPDIREAIGKCVNGVEMLRQAYYYITGDTAHDGFCFDVSDFYNNDDCTINIKAIMHALYQQEYNQFTYLFIFDQDYTVNGTAGKLVDALYIKSSREIIAASNGKIYTPIDGYVKLPSVVEMAETCDKSYDSTEIENQNKHSSDIDASVIEAIKCIINSSHDYSIRTSKGKMTIEIYLGGEENGE